MMKDWELSLGFYPGIMIGFRSYPDTGNGVQNHVLYMPFVDLCLTIVKETNEE